MKIIYGLGNRGRGFAGTRHNLGEATVHAWEEQAAPEKLKLARLVYPLGMMNSSGHDVRRELKIKLVSPSDCSDWLLVHDDMELPLGEVRLTRGGSAKGHRGVKSVLDALGTAAVPRLRLGIGRPPAGVEAREFVLTRFEQPEKECLARMTDKAVMLIDQFLCHTGDGV